METPHASSVQSEPVSATAFQTVVTTTTTVVTYSPPSAQSTSSMAATETSSTLPTTSRDTSTTSSTPISSSLTTSSTSSAWPSFSLDIISSSSASTSAPAYLTGISFAPTTSTSSSQSHDPTVDPGPLPTTNEPSGMAGLSAANKKAIVGSLAGAIGFMVLLGILLCVCLRRRHRKEEVEADASNEDGLKKPAKTSKPSVVRQWSEFALGGAKQRSTPSLVQPSTPSAIDGSLIRVSTDHWSRPYAKSSGPRESLRPAPLRIVNPDDRSRSVTPQPESNSSFLRKQRSAIAAILQDRPRMGSRSSSREQMGAISYPKPVQTNPVQSGRAVFKSAAPRPSVGSDPSEASLQIVTQRPPEDPFMASNMEIAQEIAPPSPPRGKPVPQRAYPKPAAKAAVHPAARPVPPQQLARMKSQFGKSSNPWRGNVIPSVALPPRIKSYDSNDFGSFDFRDNNRESVTSAYTRRQTAGTTRTARSEQFDLMISPTLPDNNVLEKAIEAEEQRKQQQQQQQKREKTPAESSSPNWALYEGT